MTNVMTEAMWLTGERCPVCGETLVNASRQGDEYPVLACVSERCGRPIGSAPYYAVVGGRLVPYCVYHNQPVAECQCKDKDGEPNGNQG